MMQEVGSSDDTNGESTFEFVDRKMDDLQLSGGQTALNDSSHSRRTSFDQTTSEEAPPLDSSSSLLPTPLRSSPAFTPILPTAVPPPSSLPTFLGASRSVVSSPLRPSYVVLPYSVTSPPLMSQPSHSMLPGPLPPPAFHQSESSSVYDPNSYGGGDGSSTTLDLTMSTGGYTDPFPRPSGESEAQGSGMWGWIKGTVTGNDFLTKVAEKAKNSVDSMITTLDPQMKQYIYSGGDIDVVVASDKDDKIFPIRESFQLVFGRATVTGMFAQANIAAQPVGHSAGVKGAEERIGLLRQAGQVHERQPVVAIENFLAELTPERWFDVGCLVLDDPAIGEPLHVYTQATPVPIRYVNMLREETRNDYPLRWSGFAVTIGSVIGRTLQVPRTEWHEYFGGVPRRDMIFAASKTLATVYKQRLQEMGSGGGRITVQ